MPASKGELLGPCPSGGPGGPGRSPHPLAQDLRFPLRARRQWFGGYKPRGFSPSPPPREAPRRESHLHARSSPGPPTPPGRVRLCLGPDSVSRQQSKPTFLPRFLASDGRTFAAALLSHFTEAETEPQRQCEFHSLRMRTLPPTTAPLRQLLQGPLPRVTKGKLRPRAGKGPGQGPAERGWAAVLSSEGLSRWGPPSSTHTRPHALTHTHHVVDGQGGGGDADVEAAAGVAGGSRAGGHGAAVPCS